jgi:putative spermidine/putrescine transport system substrate-binding protein
MVAAAVGAAALTLAGCGSSSSGGSSSAASGAASASTASSKPAGLSVPNIPAATALGKGEGALNIIVWAGYAEDGTDDKTVDWVHPFEDKTGCKVNVKVGNSSDEMVSLMKTGQYDGVSASGDATLRLIYGGNVAPVNTALVPNYATLELGRQRDVRHPARLGRQRVDVEPQDRDHGTDVMGLGLRREQPVQGQDHRVRLADLHR